MSESGSTTSTTKKFNYLSLLQQIDELLKLSNKWKNSHNVTPEDWNASGIEAIFENLTVNIRSISEQLTFEKRAMFLITILNTIVRASTFDEFGYIIAQESFQLMFKELESELGSVTERIGNETDSYPTLAGDMLESILLNLIKDDFVETCFNRLLSNDTASPKELPMETSVAVNTTDDVTGPNCSESILITEISDSARDVFQNDLENNHINTINKEYAQDERIDFNQIVEFYIRYAHGCTYYAVFRSTYNFRNNYRLLMISLQVFIDNYLTNTNKHVPLVPLNVVVSILELIWNMTDKIALIPMFIDADYVEKAIQWIRKDTFEANIEHLGLSLLSIIYNLSRDKKGLKQLREKKAFDILMAYKGPFNDKNNEEMTKPFGMVLIALATSDEESEENKKLILDTGAMLYNSCREADKATNLRYKGLHLSESLELLHRAFSNTYVIKHILDNMTDKESTPIQYFAQLLLSFYGALLDPEPDELEKRVARYLLKIILQISSYPEYLKKLIDNSQFCIIAECLANRPKQDDAKRIWCNIEQITSPNKPKKVTSSNIYVSFEWADEKFCKEFVQELRERITIPIWVDYENVELNEDIWEYSSLQINSAAVIIVLVSTAYGESTDKFQELSYIISTKNEEKCFIAVEAERDFSFNRCWMRDLLVDETIIPFEKNNIGRMASKVSKQIVVSKKPLIKCLPCRIKSVRKTKAEGGDSAKNPENGALKTIASATYNLAPIKAYNEEKPSNTADISDVLSSTRKHSSYSIVTGLITQTGSTDASTWV